MAIVENRIVEAIGLLDLVERLRDQEGLDPVARHEGERALEEIQPSERRKFVEHQQQAPRSIARPEFFGETAPDLVEDEPDERQIGRASCRERVCQYV